MLINQGVRGGPFKGLLAGEQFIERHAQRIDVGARINRIAATLFWRAIGRRTDRGAGHGQIVLAGDLADAEVGDLDHALGGDHKVSRLDVAMHNVVLRGLGQSSCGLNDVRCGFLGCERLAAFGPLVNDVGKICALDEFHHEVDDVVLSAGRIDLDHMRRLEQAGGARLLLEARTHRHVLGEIGGQNFDRAAALEADLATTVHHAHAAFTKHATDFVIPQAGAGQRSLAALEMPAVVHGR